MLCVSSPQSQSVESKHAVFSWDPKTLAFTLRDLGTINGVSSVQIWLSHSSPKSKVSVGNHVPISVHVPIPMHVPL